MPEKRKYVDDTGHEYFVPVSEAADFESQMRQAGMKVSVSGGVGAAKHQDQILAQQPNGHYLPVEPETKDSANRSNEEEAGLGLEDVGKQWREAKEVGRRVGEGVLDYASAVSQEFADLAGVGPVVNKLQKDYFPEDFQKVAQESRAAHPTAKYAAAALAMANPGAVENVLGVGAAKMLPRIAAAPAFSGAARAIAAGNVGQAVGQAAKGVGGAVSGALRYPVGGAVAGLTGGAMQKGAEWSKEGLPEGEEYSKDLGDVAKTAGMGALIGGVGAPAAVYAANRVQRAIRNPLSGGQLARDIALKEAATPGEPATSIMGGAHPPKQFAAKGYGAGGEPKQKAIEVAYGKVKRGIQEPADQLRKEITAFKSENFGKEEYLEPVALTEAVGEARRIVNEASDIPGVEVNEVRNWLAKAEKIAGEQAVSVAPRYQLAPPKPETIGTRGDLESAIQDIEQMSLDDFTGKIKYEEPPTLTPEDVTYAVSQKRNTPYSDARASVKSELARKIEPEVAKRPGVTPVTKQPFTAEDGYKVIDDYVAQGRQDVANWAPDDPNPPWLKSGYEETQAVKPKYEGFANIIESEAHSHGYRALNKIRREAIDARRKAGQAVDPDLGGISWDDISEELGLEAPTKVLPGAEQRAARRGREYSMQKAPFSAEAEQAGAKRIMGEMAAEGKTPEIVPTSPKGEQFAERLASEGVLSEMPPDEAARSLVARLNAKQLDEAIKNIAHKIKFSNEGIKYAEMTPEGQKLAKIHAALLRARNEAYPQWGQKSEEWHRRISEQERLHKAVGGPEVQKPLVPGEEVPELSVPAEQHVRSELAQYGGPGSNVVADRALEELVRRGGGTAQDVAQLKDIPGVAAYMRLAEDAKFGGARVGLAGAGPSSFLPLDAVKMRADALARTIAGEPGLTANPLLNALAAKYGVSPARIYYMLVNFGGNNGRDTTGL